MKTIRLTGTAIPAKMNAKTLRDKGKNKGHGIISVRASRKDGYTLTYPEQTDGATKVPGKDEWLKSFPGYVDVDVEDNVDEKKFKAWMRTVTVPKDEKEELAEMEAEELFDKLMLSPRFRAAIGQ